MWRKIKTLSLRVQLIIVICLVLVPMNILLIAMNIVSTKNAEDRLRDSYVNEINSLVRRLEVIDSNIETEADAFFLNYNDKFSQTTPLETLSIIYIMEELKVAWQKIDLVSGAFFKERESGQVYMTYDTTNISFAAQDELAEIFADEALASQTQKPETVFTDSSNYFWVWSFAHNGYVFGFFCSLDHIAEAFGQDLSEEIYILDDQKNLLAYYDFGGSAEDVSSLIFTQLAKDKESFQEDVPFVYNTIGLLIPESSIASTMPLVLRIFQFCAIFALILIPVLWLSIHRIVLRPISQMTFALKELEKDNTDYRLDWEKAGSIEIRYMEQAFNQMVQQIKDLRIEKYEAEIEKIKIETMNIMLQINPHLLLNSLSLIASLAKIKDYDTIQRFAMRLASYFRYSIRNPDAMVTVEDELAFVKDYLDIQKIRYPGTFTSVYDMDERLKNIRIPSLLIENFVENSIKYALKMGEVIEIIIIVREDGDNLIISIIDNGNGMDETVLNKLRQGEMVQDKIGRHIGIWNIRRRLKLIYKEDHHLNISSKLGEGTQVWIKIPKEGDYNNDAFDRG